LNTIQKKTKMQNKKVEKVKKKKMNCGMKERKRKKEIGIY